MGWPAPAIAGLLAIVSLPHTTAALQTDTTESSSTLIPIPALFYQPETGTGFGAVVGYYFRLGPAGVPSPATSSLQLSAIYTSKKQILTGLDFELFPRRGLYWIEGSVGYQRFPTKFWGVGNETPDTAEEDYTPQFGQLTVNAQRRVATGWYAGVTLLARRRTLTAVTAGAGLDGPAVRGTGTIGVLGIGLVVTADHRDRVLAPRRGSLHALRALVHPAGAGNTHGFSQVTVDLRTYLPLDGAHVLALRALGIATAANPPFDHLPQLGGDVLLRGYFQGRIRDRQLVAFEGDYRFPIAWIIRGVAFGGAGQVANALDDLRPDRFNFNAGAGLRFVVDRAEGLAIRVDYAWGFDANSSGLYFGIGEAF